MSSGQTCGLMSDFGLSFVDFLAHTHHFRSLYGQAALSCVLWLLLVKLAQLFLRRLCSGFVVLYLTIFADEFCFEFCVLRCHLLDRLNNQLDQVRATRCFLLPVKHTSRMIDLLTDRVELPFHTVAVLDQDCLLYTVWLLVLAQLVIFFLQRGNLALVIDVCFLYCPDLTLKLRWFFKCLLSQTTQLVFCLLSVPQSLLHLWERSCKSFC